MTFTFNVAETVTRVRRALVNADTKEEARAILEEHPGSSGMYDYEDLGKATGTQVLDDGPVPGIDESKLQAVVAKLEADGFSAKVYRLPAIAAQALLVVEKGST